MRDWKCYVTTPDRNLSWDHRDVTGLWGELEPWAPYLAVIPGLYANDINSHPTPAGRCLTLICICSRVIGIGMERNEEWGRFWFCGVCGWQGWCLTGPCLGPSAEHDTIIPIVIFPLLLPCSPHLQIPAQLLCWHATPISEQTQPNNHKPDDDYRLKKSLMWKEKCHVFWLFRAIVSSSEVSISSPSPSSLHSPLSRFSDTEYPNWWIIPLDNSREASSRHSTHNILIRFRYIGAHLNDITQYIRQWDPEHND